jgi:hypothetical protein
VSDVAMVVNVAMIVFFERRIIGLSVLAEHLLAPYSASKNIRSDPSIHSAFFE